ncbi:phosphonoacetaldehyde hydrolase [Komagataeibacter swingsii]|uniref:Phosphonoacetaldehyde hydrolase n=1 Tax=Komagataeibacter swingsii TaxID=215220 RepID=A0A850P241_9PROT|nr:phosphonoacetaldehyde hydrolase [Komagataeibacter swingsii]NVN36730.1 phosphonoacetaldehyde hydrolase [Komagataeibacter swingsii]
MPPFRHLRAVIFDWAGTLVDYGSRAPMGVFVEAFAQFGVAITIAEARIPMGMAKRPHIAALLAQPRIHAAWRQRHGSPPTEQDIDAIYAVFVPRNISVASRHADIIPGAADVLAAMRQGGLKIGSTTGYTREIMNEILPVAARQGVDVDSLVCSGETSEGRPSPFMIWHALAQMNVWPTRATVKVDDTPVGIGEGLNAGAWTVGVALSGNAFGCAPDEMAALPATEFAARRAAAYAQLTAAGAHVVIDSVADLLPVLWAFDGRMARGEHP